MTATVAASALGTYTLRVKALGSGSAYRLDSTWPVNANLNLELWNPSNVKVASTYSTTARPETLSYTIPSGSTGSYTLKVISANYGASYTLSSTYPRAYKEQIQVDANDHAVSIDDGQSTITETLSPSGRVLRRRVTNDVTGNVTEDVTFGYSDNGDSPSYSKPTAGGAVTTYVNGPAGLLVIDTAGTPTYPIQNGHGDIVGTTDANGAYTANSATDEFGVGEPPANRLGWLGSKERFSTGGNLRLVRMGVRLYDPNLGRFLSVDPVEGGSANDYDYVYGDCVNKFDLDGRAEWSRYHFKKLGQALKGFCKNKWARLATGSMSITSLRGIIGSGVSAAAGGAPRWYLTKMTGKQIAKTGLLGFAGKAFGPWGIAIGTAIEVGCTKGLGVKNHWDS